MQTLILTLASKVSWISTESVLGQPGLHIKTLFQKQKNNQPKKVGFMVIVLDGYLSDVMKTLVESWA